MKLLSTKQKVRKNIMIKAPIIFDKKSYSSKPADLEVKDIKNRCRDAGIKELTLEEIYQKSISGYSFIPGILVGGLAVSDWKYQQLFGIDVDDGIGVEDALVLYRTAGVEPFAMYYSFSHTPEHPKFRLLFCLDERIDSLPIRNMVMKILIGIVGCADKKCVDAARYFNGTSKGGEYFGEKTISLHHVLALWKDEYDLKKRNEAKGAKQRDSKQRGKRNNQAYVLTVDDNDIPVVNGVFKANAEKDLAALDRFFELRRWEEGDHRERFVFIYYNVAKLKYGAEEALKMVKEKNLEMDDFLYDRELYWAITHVEEHEEIQMPFLHGDGVFLFNRETMASEEWLDMTEDEICQSAFLDSSRKNQRADENRSVKEDVKKQVIKLHQEGVKTAAIAKEIEKKFGVSISKRTIQRYAKCDKIPQTIFNNIIFKGNNNVFFKETEFDDLEEIDSLDKESYSTLNRRQRRALNEALKGYNLFITGGAGVGKSYAIKVIIQSLQKSGKSVAVCAASALAASVYEDGMTFHRLFGFKSNGLIFPQVLERISEYDVIVIEEVGMLGKSAMDYLWAVLQKMTYKYKKMPQLIILGDVLQLPPIGDQYFFKSDYYEYFHFEPHYLIDSVRQKDSECFFHCLNEIRLGKKVWKEINSICNHGEDYNSTYLVPRNNDADIKNEECLSRLEGELIDLGNGQFVKIGAKVICKKNKYKDGVIQYYNGMQGTVVRVSAKRHVVTIQNTKAELIRIQKCDMELRNGEIKHQFPFQLGYAITIHASQGMTLESANINPHSFASGQLYVALSRVKSAEGVHLLQSVCAGDIMVNKKALEFDEDLRAQCGIEMVVEAMERESERE